MGRPNKCNNAQTVAGDSHDTVIYTGGLATAVEHMSRHVST